MVEETEAECDWSRTTGPRCGVDVEVETFRRFALRLLFCGSRAADAGEASDLFSDHNPTE